MSRRYAIGASGIYTDAIESPGQDLHTTRITDPDSRDIELVEWPPMHAGGLTAADWAQYKQED